MKQVKETKNRENEIKVVELQNIEFEQQIDLIVKPLIRHEGNFFIATMKVGFIEEWFNYMTYNSRHFVILTIQKNSSFVVGKKQDVYEVHFFAKHKENFGIKGTFYRIAKSRFQIFRIKRNTKFTNVCLNFIKHDNLSRLKALVKDRGVKPKIRLLARVNDCVFFRMKKKVYVYFEGGVIEYIELLKFDLFNDYPIDIDTLGLFRKFISPSYGIF